MLEENKLEAKTISQCKALRYKLKQIITSHSNAGGGRGGGVSYKQGGAGQGRAGQVVSQVRLEWGLGRRKVQRKVRAHAHK